MSPNARSRRLAAVCAGALCAALAAVPAQADPGSIVNAAHPDAVDGHYIVTLADETATDQATAQLADAHGATITHNYSHALSGFAAVMSPRQAERLAADPAVASVEADRVVGLGDIGVDAVQPNPPNRGLDRIDQRDLPLDRSYEYPDSAGNGTTVYVIDTGVRYTHQDFGGRASSGYDFVDNDTDASDCNGHGTHQAGIVAGKAHGVAKSARIVAVRVLDCNGAGSLSGVIAGVDWVTNAVLTAPSHRPSAANMALGSTASPTLDAAVRNSILGADVGYAVASGSSNQDACKFSPGRVKEAVTVGRSGTHNDDAANNNYGPCLDLFAPGSGITSTWYTSDTATATLSGSAATAHVGGAMALYLAEFPTALPAQVAADLVGNATPGRLINLHPTSPNLLLYTAFLN